MPIEDASPGGMTTPDAALGDAALGDAALGDAAPGDAALGDAQAPVDHCALSPCLNGGVCIDSDDGYVCECVDGYVGANCETPPPVCDGVDVAYAGGDLPPDIAGHYTEAFDCTPEEGGAFFGGVDPAHCFRKDDGSPWRIWNTGCGWEFGLTVPSDFDPARIEWVRHARTYSGQCDAIPPAQLGTDALTTSTFYDGFGEPILGLESAYCGAPPPPPVCDGGGAVPCNGCPAGTVVPDGWACIPAGPFQMGSPANEPGRGGDETQHQQDISRPYLMKVTEVTQGEWFARMGTRPSGFAACGDTCPVEQVNWYEAVAYVNALSSAEGLARCYADAQGNDYDVGDAGAETTPVWRNGTACRGYRLPTEAEWEKAARAGTATASYNGPVGNLACVLDANLDAIAWYCGNANNTTHPVRGKRANDWGLYDMLGNVWEWCWDWGDAYPGAPAADYGGPAAGVRRIHRGGSWYNDARSVRAAFRGGYDPVNRFDNVGFRPARSVIP